MVKIVFMCLCGCLYVIGLPFGWDYKETSIYICIYACPIICMLCAFISLFSCNIRTFWGRCRTSLNASLLLLYASATGTFWAHYGEVADPFTLCMNDIIEIANKLHISYELCNLYIYCVLFSAIILFHLGQFIVFKHRKKKSLEK